MATRVTPDEVRVVITTSYDDVQLQAVIDVANAWINSTLADAECHTEESLKAVELYLSAHLVAINEQRASSEKEGDATVTYSRPGVLLEGLHGTVYGQTALMMDCSGILQNAGKSKVQLAFFGQVE